MELKLTMSLNHCRPFQLRSVICFLRMPYFETCGEKTLDAVV